MIEVFINNESLGYELPYLFDDANIKLEYFGSEIEQVQANFDLTDLTFTGESVKKIKLHEQINGAFEQLPIKILINGTTYLEGYISDFEINDNQNKIKASFTKSDLNLIAERLQGVTSLLIADKYNLTTFDFIIEKSENEIKKDLALLLITNIMYVFIIKQVTKESKDYIASLTNVAPTDTFRKFLQGALLIIYIASIAYSLFKVIKQLKDLLLPSVKRTKGVSLLELLTRPLEFLGFNLVTNISDFGKIIHWASRFTKDQNTQLIGGTVFNKKIKKTSLFVPNAKDRLYNALEVFKFVQEKYNCRFYVKGNDVFCYHKNDPFWDKLAKLELEEDLPLVNYKKNTDEHYTSLEINYETDFADTWTLENFTGNHFLVTSQIKDNKKSTATGYKAINYGVARTSRKDKLNIVESFWEVFVKVVNELADLVSGGKTNGILSSRIGVAKISNETFNTAKLVYIENGKIPKNHNDKINAKQDYINYGFANSFVLQESNKKFLYENVKIKCNLEKFAKLQDNKMLTLKDSRKAEVRSLEWFPRKNYAILSLAVEENYLTKLEENYYESEK